MNYPNLNEEKKFWKKGFKFVVGIDEAGRGPLAGPVVAGAVVLINHKFKNLNSNVNDSKKLTPKQREEIYDYFKKNTDIKWGIGIVSEKIIDKINILEAT
ncbi:MAG: ribonuclease HII, partial [Candidatus Parcubacteria bacterium]|nr:ribonuclease HII [Candidatus Parcubacteria bacterium]